MQTMSRADDVELESSMCDWTEAQARVFFERMIKPVAADVWEKWFPHWSPPETLKRLRLVCFHPAGTSASIYNRLLEDVQSDPKYADPFADEVEVLAALRSVLAGRAVSGAPLKTLCSITSSRV